MGLFFASLVCFSLALLGMAIGVIFRDRRLLGSCGGLARLEKEKGEVVCAICGASSGTCMDTADRAKDDPRPDPSS